MFYIDLENTYPTRYDLGKFIDWSTGSPDILSSYFLNQFAKLEIAGTITITTEQFRPDLISAKLYQSEQYWWLIMYFNGIYDPLKLTQGLVLNYFSLTELENIYFQLRSKALAK